MFEAFNLLPKPAVLDVEFRRLLGYPPDHEPSARAQELTDWARDWYANHGRPWGYVREVTLQTSPNGVKLDGMDFTAANLSGYFRRFGSQRALLAVVSAGREGEEYARQLWQEGKPDEYYFLETFGSAVVEHLIAMTNARVCALAETKGLLAVPHYSPGYTGWDVADQTRLFELIARTPSQPLAGPLEVLASGMLRPKKSLLAVIGLTAHQPGTSGATFGTPCENCAFSPCRFRRAPFRHAVERSEDVPSASREANGSAPLTPGASYTVNLRALRKWAQERVRIEAAIDGSIEACFRFDGTTCSNLGRPLAFDYQVTLSGPHDGYQILRADCRPAAGDDGHTQMCAYLADAPALLQSIAMEKPLLGRPLDEVLRWTRPAAPSGCHCTAASRAHKWGLALEAIHYTLTHAAPTATTWPETQSS